MSSINPHFTFNYSQPEEYQFSHDSVFLARTVFEREQHLPIEALRLLDLCAGCGIIGMDFVFHCEKELGKSPQHVDFLEIQDIYADHFLKNAKNLKTPNLQFWLSNYTALLEPKAHQQYDLILCNPPYFLPAHGKLSPSAFKNRCRFFIDSDLKTLIKGIENSLKPKGRAYALIKESESHNYFPIKGLEDEFSEKLKFTRLEPLRGTPLVLLEKK